MTGRESLLEARVEKLEDALRDILDVATRYTRPMTPSERWDLVEKLAEEALNG